MTRDVCDLDREATKRGHSRGEAIAAYVDVLSNWYVRLSRRRFWEGDRAAFQTLRRCLIDVAALVAPFAPFLAVCSAR